MIRLANNWPLPLPTPSAAASLTEGTPVAASDFCERVKVRADTACRRAELTISTPTPSELAARLQSGAILFALKRCQPSKLLKRQPLSFERLRNCLPQDPRLSRLM